MQDAFFLFLRRIGHEQLEHEAIELRFGKRIRSFLFDRVLRGDRDEGAIERIGHAIHRHLSLLHRLQQRRLRLGRGSIDLVAEQQVREDWSAVERELAALHVEDAVPGDVAGHQVGRELHPAEVAREDATQRVDKQRLAQPGNAFDEDVPLGEQGDQDPFNEFLLADDGFTDFRGRRLERLLNVRRIHPACPFTEDGKRAILEATCGRCEEA